METIELHVFDDRGLLITLYHKDEIKKASKIIVIEEFSQKMSRVANAILASV